MSPDRYITWAIAAFVIFAAVHDVLHWLGIGLGLAWDWPGASVEQQRTPKPQKSTRAAVIPPGSAS